MITGENVFKCQSTGYQWTAWSSFTNLSDTNGNDFETLDLHRCQDSRLIDFFISKRTENLGPNS